VQPLTKLKRRKINPFNRWKHCKNNPLVKFHVLLIKSKYQNTTLTELMEADTGLLIASGKHISAHEAAKILRM